MGYIIEAENISKRFSVTTGRQTLFKIVKMLAKRKSDRPVLWALKNISFKIKKGERLAIIGGNGSGKTTLLRIITGIYKQTSGNLAINGSLSAFLQLGSGLQKNLCVLDNIYLLSAIMGSTRRHTKKKLDSITSFSGLSDYLYAPLRTLSSGMRQRLAFSIIKDADADILILDEMLSGSDADFEERSFSALEKYKKEDRSLIMVSHNMDMVKRFCDKAILLEKGDQIALGPVDEVVDRYLKKNGN